MAGSIELGREAFARHAWSEAYVFLSEADAPDAVDLEDLAIAAYLTGEDSAAAAAWERAHRAWIDRGDRDRSARCACWLGLLFLLGGQTARAGSWLARAERLIEESEHECAARGLSLVPAMLEALGTDPAAARILAVEIVDIGRRFNDGDVIAFGVLASGQASLALGETTRGMRFLDEAMGAVTAGEVSPITAGIVYCAVIESCVYVFDLRRAAEWTDSLYQWCAAQPDLVPYRGQCLIHRSQVFQARGAWAEAVAEAERACQRLSNPVHPALGLACYQQGELYRLRGEFADAERAYRAANEHGHDPSPGIALLRLAEGNVDAAAGMVRRLVGERKGGPTRPQLLAVAVEVLVAATDVEAARAASNELTLIADTIGTPLLGAIGRYASGSVLLADGDAGAALDAFRDARDRWRDLEMPYDVARARVKLALACRAVGDLDTADMELDAARAVFERLGARPDLTVLAAVAGPPTSKYPSLLTDRECEVLRLVATGRTNRQIASDLVISEHTVARHLQNIFLKLGLRSRSAATAYAYEHGLV